MTYPTPRHLWRAGSVTTVTSGNALDVSVADEGTNATNTYVWEAARRPLWIDNVLNGKPVFRFDGSDDRMSAPGDSGITAPWTVSFVAKPTATKLSEIIRMESGAPYTNIGTTAAGSWKLYSGGSADAIDGTYSTGTWVVITVTFNTTTTFFKDGTSQSLTNSTGQNSPPLGGEVYLGSSSSDYFAGDIAEWAVWNGALTAGERADWHTRVQDLYGITVSDYVGSTTTVRPVSTTTAGGWTTGEASLHAALSDQNNSTIITGTGA